MNATDVYVEQLIIGGLVVAIAVVLATGALPLVESNPVSIAVWVGIAYLAGLIYDRVGDTLLQRIEKRQRLELAATEWKKKPGSQDPYPEDAYRAAVLARGEEAARQYNYLRTRVRLARALTSLLPAATVALLAQRSAISGWLVTFDVVAAYVLVATIDTVSPELRRTKDVDFAAYIKQKNRWRTAYASSAAGLLALIALMCVIASGAADFAIIAAGVAATILAGWVWIRITRTFMEFLRDTGTEPRKRRSSAFGGHPA